MSVPVALSTEQVIEIGRLAVLKCFVSNRDDFVSIWLLNLEPMQKFENVIGHTSPREYVQTAGRVVAYAVSPNSI